MKLKLKIHLHLERDEETVVDEDRTISIEEELSEEDFQHFVKEMLEEYNEIFDGA